MKNHMYVKGYNGLIYYYSYSTLGCSPFLMEIHDLHTIYNDASY